MSMSVTQFTGRVKKEDALAWENGTGELLLHTYYKHDNGDKNDYIHMTRVAEFCTKEEAIEFVKDETNNPNADESDVREYGGFYASADEFYSVGSDEGYDYSYTITDLNDGTVILTTAEYC